MHTFLRDFFDCLSRAATFSNIGNLGDALRALHEFHPTENEQQQPAARLTPGESSTANTASTAQNPSQISVVF
jgi:hypothetical protein